MKSTLKPLIALFLLTFFGLPNQAQTQAQAQFSDKEKFVIAENLDLFYSVFRNVHLLYVDSVPTGKITTDGITKMLADLDPYTTFISKEDVDDFNTSTTGEYGGVGSVVQKRDDFVMISEPYKGFPADKAGLKAGDLILSIDGVDLKGKPVGEVSNSLKGKPNTALEVEVKRPGSDKPLSFSVLREKITINPVPYFGMIDNHTGYIMLTSFTENSSLEVKKALKSLKEQGAKSMVLDLRNNPGGILGEAVSITNLFVEKDNEVVSTRGRIKALDRTYTTTQNPIDTEMPLVVLVNGGSASASEIVSGAIQDLDRGVIVGTRTFGKGLVQQTRDLGYDAKLKITIAKYYIPSGRCIQALDYTHRNPDGSVSHVPDSLMMEFSTKNGRIVKDGGGILPDDTIQYPDLNAFILFDLLIQNKFFDFATEYKLNHQTIPPIEDFKLTDEDYNNFKTFVKDGDFEYEPQSLAMLDKLEEQSKEERSFERSKEQLDALRALLEHNVDADMDEFKKEILQILSSEIAKRYYYKSGAIQEQLKTDLGLARALEILSDKKQYNSFLNPDKNKS